MSARHERNRQSGSASLLTTPPETGGDHPRAVRRKDAAERHALARSRRERKPSPLLGGSLPVDGPAAQHTAVLGTDAAATVAPVKEAPGEPKRHPSRGGLGGVVGLTIAGALAGAMLAYALPASYEATAELLIDPAGGDRAGQLSSEAAFALVDNEVRVLRSGTMLGSVADRLNLASDADFVRPGLSGSVGGLVGGGSAPVDGRQRAVEALASAITVERVGGSSAITLSATTADPAKAALLVNTLADIYLAGSGMAGAPDRMAALRAELERAERAVEAYKVRNELVDAQGRLISDEQILTVQEQLSIAKARTLELNARAASTREANVDSIVTGSLPEQFASPTVTGLRDRLAGLKQQSDRLSTRLGPRHPERLAAEAELQAVREELAGELRRVAGALQTELKRAVQQEQELASELARMKVRQGEIGDEMIELRQLEREAEVRRSAYEEALRGAQGVAAGVSASARILSRAEPSAAATGRSAGAFSLAGALGGFLLGLGLMRRREDASAEKEGETGREEGNVGSSQSSSGTEIQRTADATTSDNGKENEPMYPYPYQAGYPTQQPGSPTHPAQPPAPQAYAPQPQPVGWQPATPMPQATLVPPAAYAPQQPTGWQPQPQAQAHQPVPVDPWAHLRGYPQPHPYMPPAFAAPAYAPPQPVYFYPVPYQQPVQQAPEVHRPQHVQAGERDWRAPGGERLDAARDSHDRYDQDRFVDERTNEAIEEIRQSLRAFREAIEDLADERFRERDRSYGT